MPSGISREKIEARAYEIWVEEGRPHGRHDEHWQRAAAEFGSSEPPSTETKPARGKRAAAGNGHDTAAPAKKTTRKTAASSSDTEAPKTAARSRTAAAKSAPAKAGAAGDTTPATKAPAAKAKRTAAKPKA